MYNLTKQLCDIYNIDYKYIELDKKIECDLENVFEHISDISMYNQAKVHAAFVNNKVSEVHFGKTTGYGYDDIGRETIDKIYADIFKAEDAMVRIQFVNGTHALSTALMCTLRNGDTLLSITGDPYDTLMETVGDENKVGSLVWHGVKYDRIDLVDNDFDYSRIKEYIENNKVSMIFIGRSRGYTSRKSITIAKMEKVIKYIKELDESINIMVDNCYGEFVETREPTEVGADIIAGSLIKNIGGSLCETGGYIAGRKDLVELAAERLTAPGIGKECGATLGKNKEILQGLYMAPSIVKNALMSVIYAARIMQEMGIKADPLFDEERTDIVQQIELNDKDRLIKFIQGIQKQSPVDSFVLPEPWAMPGYSDEVIMAAGTFVSGASIELSADAPIKPPYIAYLQGGITYESAKMSILLAAINMLGE